METVGMGISLSLSFPNGMSGFFSVARHGSTQASRRAANSLQRSSLLLRAHPVKGRGMSVR
jgi:hypothetical protein